MTTYLRLFSCLSWCIASKQWSKGGSIIVIISTCFLKLWVPMCRPDLLQSFRQPFWTGSHQDFVSKFNQKSNSCRRLPSLGGFQLRVELNIRPDTMVCNHLEKTNQWTCVNEVLISAVSLGIVLLGRISNSIRTTWGSSWLVRSCGVFSS